MTNRDRFLTALRGGLRLCDDCLSNQAGFGARQVAYQLGTTLFEAGAISRERGVTCGECRKLKICSWSGPSDESVYESVSNDDSPPERPWYWEGNVQEVLAQWLRVSGWNVRSTADTAARTQGVDIIAEHLTSGRELWVSVKGYPEKSASVQAGHWFAGAVFDLVRYRELGDHRDLAVALPDGYARYLNLAPKVSWLRNTMPFSIYWVGPDGSVRRESGPTIAQEQPERAPDERNADVTERFLQIFELGSMRTTASGNSYQECRTDAGVAAFWGRGAARDNIALVQRLRLPATLRCSCVTARWKQHAVWVPEDARVNVIDEPPGREKLGSNLIEV